MKKANSGEKILRYKFIYTVLILLGYMVGKTIPLYMVDVDAYVHKALDAEGLLLQTISGDIYQCSVFALGVSPYMISSMFMQVISAFRSSEARARISPVKQNRGILTITVVVALVQAILCVRDLKFAAVGYWILIAQTVSVVEMVAGAMLIMWICSRNKQYGIGGQSAIIFVNVLDGLRHTVGGGDIHSLWLPFVISLIVMGVMVYMENTEKHIPVQRISVHNVYADKNYLAIKFNPVGVMPAMFSMAFYMVPQMLVAILGWMWPHNSRVLWLQDNMSLDKPLGIGIYVVALYALSLIFARVFVSPRELTEQFLKSGDSLVGIHAGRDTRRYLSGVITRIGLLSATVMSVCLGLPMVLQLMGYMDSAYVTLPSSVMMLTGIWCNLYREVLAIQDLEGYRPFI